MKNFEQFGFLEPGEFFILYPGDFNQQVYIKIDKTYFANVKKGHWLTGDFDMLVLKIRNQKNI